MASVAEKEIFCIYGDVRTIFTKADEDIEFSKLCEMRKLFTDKGKATHFPVAVFAWKLFKTTKFLRKHWWYIRRDLSADFGMYRIVALTAVRATI